MSTTRRTAGVYSRKRPLGPNGERICYNCGGPLPKGRRFNCSPKCSEEWQCKTSPSHLRFVLKKRDKGVCALCRTDTIALKKQYNEIPKDPNDYNYTAVPTTSARKEFLKEHGIPIGRVTGDWWDADHILPVVEGGGECGLDNYRTLCIPCHRNETAALAKRRARARHEAKPLPLLDAALEA